MPSRIDEAGYTKAFDYPVTEHWGESQRTKRSCSHEVMYDESAKPCAIGTEIRALKN